MLIRLGAAISVSVQYLQLRKNTYQFYLRVPQHLIDHYGKEFIRKSLRTSNVAEAAKKAEVEARRYQAEFKVLSQKGQLIPQDVAREGRALAEKWAGHLDFFIDLVIDPKREKHADGDEEVYANADPSEYLTPVEMEAWKRLANPNAFRMADALRLYLKTHQRGAEEEFAKKVTRDWEQLVALTGDIVKREVILSHFARVYATET